MAAHRTEEQIKAHEDFRAELEKLYGPKKKAAAKKAASSDK
jgi:hypothetical protein